MPDDDFDADPEFVDAEFADEDEAEISEEEANGHTLSIRRADGEEIVSIVATAEEWGVALQPGGAIRNAYIGSRTDSPVWLNTWDRPIERDEDGTYVIRLD